MAKSVPGAPEARRHLIEDDEHAGGAGPLDQRLEEGGTADAHAARPLQQGLDDDGGDVLDAPRQPVFERGEGALLALLHLIVALESGGEGQHRHPTHQPAEQIEEARAAPERHGAERVAVIAAVEGEKHAPPRLAAIGPILIGDLERHLHRGGAVVGEEDARKIAGQEAGERGGEIDRGLMREAREHHMGKQFGLPRERRVERRMGMAVGAGPPGRDEVEDLAALRVEQRGPLRARDDCWLALRPVLGEGMPDMAPVAREQLGGVKRGRIALGGGFVHGSARASCVRSSSGSIWRSVSRLIVSSRGISAITRTRP